MKHRVIIDCDPGVDDALAINALFMDKETEVLAISCVGGNRPLEVVYKNALRLTDYFKQDVEVCLGEKPINKDLPVSTSYFHGLNGFGGVELEYSEKNLSKRTSIEMFNDLLNKYPNEVEIVALGPLTNLAVLYQSYPETFKKIKAIYSMGGSFKLGNITPCCEFNYYYDLDATEIVLNAVQKENIAFHMFPLDITMKVFFDMNEFTFLRFEGGDWGNLIADMFEKNYLPNSYKAIGKTICVLHDLVAAMYMLRPELFDDVKGIGVDISRNKENYGQLFEVIRDTTLYVHKDVDAYKMKEEFLRLNYSEDIIKKYKYLLGEN